MRSAMLAACVLLFQAWQAMAGDASLPDAIYRFEIGPSLEKLNLADSLAKGGKPCSFTRREPDGSLTCVVVFSDALAAHLATLQMPGVMLTFKVAEDRFLPGSENAKRNQLATIHGREISDFGSGMYIIRKEDSQGRAQHPLAIWFLGGWTACH